MIDWRFGRNNDVGLIIIMSVIIMIEKPKQLSTIQTSIAAGTSLIMPKRPPFLSLSTTVAHPMV